MTTAALDVTTLRSWVGREQHSSDFLTPSLVERYRATFDLPRGDTSIGAPAPRLIHWCLMPGTVQTGVLAPDGHPPKGEFLPPIQLPRRMWAGGKLEFYGDLRIGEPVTRTSQIVDVQVKNGRTGPLCFVTVDHAICVGGERRVREVQDIVYRGMVPVKNVALSTANKGEFTAEIAPTTTLLFRYSALTFNSHRIHYDRDYAMNIEGYSGLVVHGPLQATLLYDFAARVAKRVPAQFEFRSNSPLVDGRSFYLNGQEREGGFKLWTAQAGGPQAMTAEASW